MNLNELVAIILPKFSHIPNVNEEVVNRWIQEAVFQHGYDEIGYVPPSDKMALLNLILATACAELAVNAARFFRWQDGEELVDKSMVSAQYRQMAQFYMNEYQKLSGATRTGFRSKWKAVKRVDRR